MVQRNDYRVGQADQRPWGAWAVVDVGPGFCVKRITVVPGGVLSLQRHEHRAEDWVVVAGQAMVTLGDRQLPLGKGERVHVDRGTVHRLANPGPSDVVFIEVQQGDVLSESDIERLDDNYGRR